MSSKASSAETLKTTDLSVFKFIKGNRVLDEAHVKRLEKAIMERNLLKSNPIVVNEKMEVIDGQHRLEVARRNNLEIYYIVSDFANLEDVVSLNTHSKSWQMPDYLNSYVQKGNPDYIFLRDFVEAHQIPVSLGIEFLSTQTSTVLKEFKRGDWRVSKSRRPSEYITNWLMFEPYADTGVHRSKYFVRAIIKLTDQNINWDRMIAKLSLMANPYIKKQVNTKAYLRVLEDIYNFHQRVSITRFI